MRKRRPTRFTKVPRQTQSLGIASIRLPLARLYSQFTRYFAQQTLSKLMKGHRPAAYRDLLRAHKLDDQVLDLREWFGQLQLGALQGQTIASDFQCTSESLIYLAQSAEDLGDDDGGWTDQTEEAGDMAREAADDIRDRVLRLRDDVTAKFGPRWAGRVLTKLYRSFSRYSDPLKTEAPQWTAKTADVLRDCARRLKAMARPRSAFWRCLRWFRPAISAKFWLTRAQSKHVTTHILPTIRRAAQVRFGDEIQGHKRQVFEMILGRPGSPGILQDAHDELRQHERLYQGLSGALGIAGSDIPHVGNEIFLVDDIFTPLDTTGNLRFVDLIDQLVQRGGCTAQGLADQLRRQGITVRGRTYFPHQWTGLSVATLLKALLATVARYLGFQDTQAVVNLQRPRTATDHVATITLAHPALRYLLQQKLADLARRSRPYALFQPITGANPRIHAYLFCHPAHRKLFEQLLLIQCNITNRSNGHAWPSGNYQLTSPYVVTLAQYALAAPGGSQRDLQRALRHANRVRKEAIVPPLFDRQDYPELRLLEERPNENDDSTELFDAACAANVIVPTSCQSDRFQLSKSEPRLQGIFVQEKLAAEPRPPEFFQQQIENPVFVNYVNIRLPTLSDWHTLAENLRLHTEPESVADELVSLGILTRQPGGLYQIAVDPPDEHSDFPPGLFTRKATGMRGITKEEFLGQLVTNDWLYNAVFWQTADAFDLGRIKPDQAPEFLKQYLQQLGWE